MITAQQIKEQCNARCRTRVFSDSTIEDILSAIQQAINAAKEGLPFYRGFSAGGVANCYGYITTTATAGVWVNPETFEVETFFGRKRTSSRHAPCARYGGLREYTAECKRIGLV